ncbi:MAG: alpha/beta hydrolase [Anaerolineales bacterium]|nr:alpha/beta hydrolase [Anaerolineales bacterium]
MSIIRKSYAETSEGQVHYREVHRVSGTPLVLLHQTASSGVMFEPVMSLLSDSFHTLALDTPGFGASFLPPKRIQHPIFIRLLYAALHQLGVESCFMFGHHTGSAIAVQMAHDHPDFIQKMVLSGAPLLNESQINGLKASLKPFAIAEDGSHLTQVWERIRKRDSALALETVHREVLLTQSAREAAQSAFQAVFDQPFAEQLSALEIPILVMSGENDTLRASLEPAFSILKNGAMKLIPNEGPYICDQNPQAVADVLHEFLRR